MYNCDICGKGFTTTQALGGHRAYCGKLVRVSEGRHSEGSKLKLFSEGSEGYTLTKPSLPSVIRPGRGLSEADKVALRAWKTGRVSNKDPLKNVQWGKWLAAGAVALFVWWLVYKSLDSWEWDGRSKKKQISPYKLIGGLIQGLG